MPQNVHERVRDLLDHTRPLPPESGYPHPFYERTGADSVGTVNYVARLVKLHPVKPAVAAQHLGRLYRTALVDLVENFERFLKHAAAAAIDALAGSNSR